MQKAKRIATGLVTASFLLLAFNNCGQMNAASFASTANQAASSATGSGDTTGSSDTSGGTSTPASTSTPSATSTPVASNPPVATATPAPTATPDSTTGSRSTSSIVSQSLCLESSASAMAGMTCVADHSAQDFKLVAHDDGSVSIVNNANLCVEVDAGIVSLKTCATLSSQNLTPLLISGSNFRLISQVDGGCLQLNTTTKVLSTQHCNLSAAQSFSLSTSLAAPFTYSASLEKAEAVTAGPALPMKYKGMHLGGAESGNLTDKDRYGYNYAYPSNTLIDYVARKGFTIIRLSFKSARLQPTRSGPLDPTELARVNAVVQHANSKGLYVILDPHDYGTLTDATKTSQIIGSTAMPAVQFANFWAHVAAAFVNQPNVIYGLMNEPHAISATQWQSSAVAALSAIRSVGAKQAVFIPGVSWTGAHSWVSAGNAAVWAQFDDPATVFEVHQYFDSDSSGTHDTCSANSAVGRLNVFTAWAEATGHRGFLGEFGWADNATCDAEGDAALAHMSQHAAAYLGWSYFAAGWYNGFMTLNPANLGQATEVDKPQTVQLLKYR